MKDKLPEKTRAERAAEACVRRGRTSRGESGGGMIWVGLTRGQLSELAGILETVVLADDVPKGWRGKAFVFAANFKSAADQLKGKERA